MSENYRVYFTDVEVPNLGNRVVVTDQSNVIKNGLAGVSLALVGVSKDVDVYANMFVLEGGFSGELLVRPSQVAAARIVEHDPNYAHAERVALVPAKVDTVTTISKDAYDDIAGRYAQEQGRYNQQLLKIRQEYERRLEEARRALAQEEHNEVAKLVEPSLDSLILDALVNRS